jgi:hypothetical protein
MPVRRAVPTNRSTRMKCLGSDSARQVDGVAAGPGSDNGEEQRSRDRQADVDAVPGLHDRLPGKRERGHQLAQPSWKNWPGPTREGGYGGLQVGAPGRRHRDPPPIATGTSSPWPGRRRRRRPWRTPATAQACAPGARRPRNARRLAGLRRGHLHGVARQVRHLPGDGATVIAATPGSHTVTTSSGR